MSNSNELSNKIILVDVDGVVLNTPTMLSSWTYVDGRTNIWDGTTYKIPKALVERTFDRIEFWKALRPIEGAYEGLQRLINRGANIIFVTAPYPIKGWHSARTKLLNKYFGDLFKGDVPIIFCPSHLKQHIAGDFMIEDRADILAEWVQRQGKCRSDKAAWLMVNSYSVKEFGNYLDGARKPNSIINKIKAFSWGCEVALHNSKVSTAFRLHDDEDFCMLVSGRTTKHEIPFETGEF